MAIIVKSRTAVRIRDAPKYLKKNDIESIPGFPTLQLVLGESLCRDPASNSCTEIDKGKAKF